MCNLKLVSKIKHDQEGRSIVYESNETELTEIKNCMLRQLQFMSWCVNIQSSVKWNNILVLCEQIAQIVV